jgi:hypothetical protein
MDNLLADIRRAARVLGASPGLVLVSVVSLGLGLGANLTLFSFLRATFFYPPEVAEPVRVPGMAVTVDFFTALGIPAGIGRTFNAAEAAPERQPRIAVLSHAFWQQRFSGSAATIGQSVTINGEP